MNYSPTDEEDWKHMLSSIGLIGLVWAVIKLLLRKNIFSTDELRAEVASAAVAKRLRPHTNDPDV